MYFLQEQAAVICLLQDHFRSPFADLFFKLWNFFDTKEFFFLLIPLTWFGYNRKLGIRILYGVLFSGFINSLLKDFFQCPRPFILFPELTVLSVSGFSFPSGAAQTSIFLPFTFALHFNRASVWIISGFFALLLSFSRIYLGVHFPLDLLIGWLVGGGILYFLWDEKYFEKIFRFWESANAKKKILYTAFIGGILFAQGRLLASIFIGTHVGMLLFPKYDRQEKNIHLKRALLQSSLNIGGSVACLLSYELFSLLSGSTYKTFLEVVLYSFIGFWLSVGTNIIYSALNAIKGKRRLPLIRIAKKSHPNTSAEIQ